MGPHTLTLSQNNKSCRPVLCDGSSPLQWTVQCPSPSSMSEPWGDEGSVSGEHTTGRYNPLRIIPLSLSKIRYIPYKTIPLSLLESRYIPIKTIIQAVCEKSARCPFDKQHDDFLSQTQNKLHNLTWTGTIHSSNKNNKRFNYCISPNISSRLPTFLCSHCSL